MASMCKMFFDGRSAGRFDYEDGGHPAATDNELLVVVLSLLYSEGKNRQWEDTAIFQAVVEEAHRALFAPDPATRVAELGDSIRAAAVYDRLTQVVRSQAKAWLRRPFDAVPGR